MNYNCIICFDLESTGKSSKTAQIVQIGAICVDSRRLEIMQGTEFNILIKMYMILNMHLQ